MSKNRNFTFTWNNYPTDYQRLLTELPARYVIAGEEVAPSTLTPHLQGTVVFTNATTLKSVISKLPGCHVEICKALDASIAYCKKEGVFFEHGIPPVTRAESGEREKRKWREILEAAREGRNDEIPDDIRFNQPHVIKRHRMDYLMEQTLEDTESPMLWYYGASGTGKSRKAREENPGAYLKTANKWWDGYMMEDTVIIEDLDARHEVLAHHLKIWADRYPFPAEVKGGMIKIRPKKIIVTSNYHPTDIWTKDQDIDPILRRFTLIKFEKKNTDPRCAANFVLE